MFFARHLLRERGAPLPERRAFTHAWGCDWSGSRSGREAGESRRVRKTIALYGLLGGVLIAVLKLIEYRYLVVDRTRPPR